MYLPDIMIFVGLGKIWGRLWWGEWGGVGYLAEIRDQRMKMAEPVKIIC